MPQYEPPRAGQAGVFPAVEERGAVGFGIIPIVTWHTRDLCHLQGRHRVTQRAKAAAAALRGAAPVAAVVA